MSKKKVALLLKSPLQSWGVDSKFGIRSTFSYPSKSAIAGIICAAAGVDKYAPDANAQLSVFASFELECLRLRRVSDEKVNPTPAMSDFHTVGGGYDKSNPKEQGHCLRSADGKLSADAMITKRYYNQDDCFFALLDTEKHEEIGCALSNPKWGIWLGRKACVPSLPTFVGIFDKNESAIQYVLEKLEEMGTSYQIVSRMKSAVDFSSSEFVLLDEPLDFKNRRFGSRGVFTE